jgi:hypothetical protein
MPKNTPSTLMAFWRRNSSVLVSISGLAMNSAALLSRMSMLPKLSSASFTIAAQSASLDTSWRSATA